MARTVMTLEEAVAFLNVVGAPAALVEKFMAQAGAVYAKRDTRGYDAVSVTSGFGQKTRVGYVELQVNDQRTQMDVRKAREIGLMLIQAAEAASSDQMFVELLKRIGLEDDERVGPILLELRDIRQGTRDISWPS
jgi:hypothetical protein